MQRFAVKHPLLLLMYELFKRTNIQYFSESQVSISLSPSIHPSIQPASQQRAMAIHRPPDHFKNQFFQNGGESSPWQF